MFNIAVSINNQPGEARTYIEPGSPYLTRLGSTLMQVLRYLGELEHS